jgi:uncharacterized protein YbcI
VLLPDGGDFKAIGVVSRYSFVGFSLPLPRARSKPRDEREGRMKAPDPPLVGEELLAAVTDSMVALHQRYHHRPPGSAKAQMLADDLIAVVMGEVYTDVEKTLIELQHGPVVKATRSAFQTAMRKRFIDEVERLSGREVVAFLSDSHVGPDMEVELFVLREPV